MDTKDKEEIIGILQNANMSTWYKQYRMNCFCSARVEYVDLLEAVYEQVRIQSELETWG